MQSTRQLPAAQTIKSGKKKVGCTFLCNSYLLFAEKTGVPQYTEKFGLLFGSETGHTGSSSVLDNQTLT